MGIVDEEARNFAVDEALTEHLYPGVHDAQLQKERFLLKVRCGQIHAAKARHIEPLRLRVMKLLQSWCFLDVFSLVID